jgi:hypothetical protein
MVLYRELGCGLCFASHTPKLSHLITILNMRFNSIIDFIFRKKPLGKRASGWNDLRRKHLLKHPICAVCGGVKKLEVHHILPVHLFPEKELEITNLITLCEGKKWVNCHLFFGHLGSYISYNPDVKKDADIFNNKLSSKYDLQPVKKTTNR